MRAAMNRALQLQYVIPIAMTIRLDPKANRKLKVLRNQFVQTNVGAIADKPRKRESVQ